MLPRRLATTAISKPLSHSFRPTSIPLTSRVPRSQVRCISQAEIEDPNQNGGYINPPPENRQNRDPYGDWWDKQERRNFGEPVHEDNDILGVMSPYEYKHFTPGWGAVLLGTFVAGMFGLCAVVYPFYPDKPSAPRTFPGGLDRELGGRGKALIANEEQE